MRRRCQLPHFGGEFSQVVAECCILLRPTVILLAMPRTLNGGARAARCVPRLALLWLTSGSGRARGWCCGRLG